MLGFYMIILLTGLQSIPPHLYEAAAIDGAAGWRALPAHHPAAAAAVALPVRRDRHAELVHRFDLVYVMTSGGPGHATELLVTYIYKAGFGQTQFDYAAALTVVHSCCCWC